MSPKHFPGANIVIAKNQPPYLPLPAHYSGDEVGTVVSCWELTEQELAELLKTKCIWLTQCTFGQLLQPQAVSVEQPFMEDVGEQLKDEDTLPLKCGHGIPMGLYCDECLPDNGHDWNCATCKLANHYAINRCPGCGSYRPGFVPESEIDPHWRDNFGADHLAQVLPDNGE